MGLFDPKETHERRERPKSKAHADEIMKVMTDAQDARRAKEDREEDNPGTITSGEASPELKNIDEIIADQAKHGGVDYIEIDNRKRVGEEQERGER